MWKPVLDTITIQQNCHRQFLHFFHLVLHPTSNKLNIQPKIGEINVQNTYCNTKNIVKHLNNN